MKKRIFTLLVVMLALCLPAWSQQLGVRGDLSGDGIVDVTDVNLAIDIVLGKAELNLAADLDGNGEVDVTDVSMMIDIVLGKAPNYVDLGIYAGIIGFNDHLYTKPISMLNTRTEPDFTSFVNELDTRKGTVLYWAVDNALSMLDAASTPQDLTGVMLVTFTDGLDQGSLMYNSNFITNDAYLTALKERINRSYKGIPLTAFTIGLKGSDVNDVTLFRNNLKQLASSDENAVEVTNMTGVNQQLVAIADRLSLVTKTQNLSLTIPGQSDGTKVRFTFDNVSDAAKSSLYIDGTFNMSDRSLRSVTYNGISCSSGSTVKGTVDGIFVTYQFINTRRASTREILSKTNIKQWSYVPSMNKWQLNSEFSEAQETLSNASGLVMLALDCSSSMSELFSTMKSYANTFIHSLAAAAPPPPPVISTSAVDNKLNFECYAGQSVTNTFTVYGLDLNGAVTAEVTNGSDVFSVSPKTISQSSATNGKMVTVTFSPKAGGNHTGVLRLSSEGAHPVMITLSGKAIKPVITATPDELDFSCYPGQTVTKKITVKGTNLAGSVTAAITSGGNVFSVSPTSISKSSATNGTTVTVTYSPSAAGFHNAVLKLTSDYAQAVSAHLTGKSLTVPGPDNAELFTVNGVPFKMVAVEGGTFQMGGTAEQQWVQDNEKPVHQVTVSNFSIGATEVTQDLWQAVMGANPSKFCAANGYEEDLQRPVEMVTWNDCQTFITKLNQLTGKTFRLPTEAEWEYAARGGNMSNGTMYAGGNDPEQVAWCSINSDKITHAVGTKAPNELGLYDMSGNVQDWCHDFLGTYTDNAQINPTGPATGDEKAARGGSWYYGIKYSRVSARIGGVPSNGYSSVGLRLAYGTSISSSESQLDFSCYPGETVTKQITVKGISLTGSVMATIISGGDVFSVSPQTISKSNATNGATVTVTYSPSAVGNHSGVLRLNSSNAQTVTVSLSGNSVQKPTITASPANLDFSCYANEMVTKQITVKGTGLTGSVTAAITSGGDVFSVSPQTISKSNATNGVKVTVTYSPSAVGAHSGVLKLTSENAQEVMVSLSGNALQPVITASPANLDFSCYAGETVSQQITVKGFGLKGSIMATITSGGDVFSVSPQTISKSNATNGVAVTVNYSPGAVGTHSGVLKLTSDGAQAVTVSLSGNALQPVITASPANLDFLSYVGETVTEQISIKGTGLTGSVTAAIISGGNVFSVSPQTISSRDANNGAMVTVTYSPNAVGTHSGVLKLTSDKAQAVTVNLSGNAPQHLKQTFTVNGVSFTMVSVHGGTFTMGASDDDTEAIDNERPAHQVTLSSYSIGETEVTQELWQAVMGANPSYFTGNLQRPVERFSWNDCQTFITKLNQLTGKTFRLPTEAEWEYAARGGNKSQGYKYSGSNTIGDVAWYYDNSDWQTYAVSTKSPNELGLYDMTGNAYELCRDWFGDYSSNAQTNPTGPTSGEEHVIRGGGHFTSARFCRVSVRGGILDNNFVDSTLGLRLAL